MRTLTENDVAAMRDLMRTETVTRWLGFTPTIADLQRHTWGDPDFDPSFALGVCHGDALQGFVLGIRRAWKANREATGFIKWLQVSENAPPGTRDALLDACVEAMTAKGVREFEYGASAPGYLVPGVPEEDTPLADALTARGWETSSTRVSLVGAIGAPVGEAPLLEGFSLVLAGVDDGPRVSGFVAAGFGESWAKEIQPAFDAQSPAFCSLLKEGEALRGFAAIHAGNPNWFGPMGVDPACRGRGLGTALLRHAAGEAGRRGVPRLLISWMTGRETFYGRVLAEASALRFRKFVWRGNV